MFIERSELERTGPVTPERFVVYEFPPGAMPPATLYLRGADAVVLWGRDSEVLLLSRDGGRSWRGVAEPGQ